MHQPDLPATARVMASGVTKRAPKVA